MWVGSINECSSRNRCWILRRCTAGNAFFFANAAGLRLRHHRRQFGKGLLAALVMSRRMLTTPIILPFSRTKRVPISTKTLFLSLHHQLQFDKLNGLALQDRPAKEPGDPHEVAAGQDAEPGKPLAQEFLGLIAEDVLDPRIDVTEFSRRCPRR